MASRSVLQSCFSRCISPVSTSRLIKACLISKWWHSLCNKSCKCFCNFAPLYTLVLQRCLNDSLCVLFVFGVAHTWKPDTGGRLVKAAEEILLTEFGLVKERRFGVRNGQSNVSDLCSVVLKHYMSVSTPRVPQHKHGKDFWERQSLSHGGYILTSPTPHPSPKSPCSSTRQISPDTFTELFFFLTADAAEPQAMIQSGCCSATNSSNTS